MWLLIGALLMSEYPLVKEEPKPTKNCNGTRNQQLWRAIKPEISNPFCKQRVCQLPEGFTCSDDSASGAGCQSREAWRILKRVSQKKPRPICLWNKIPHSILTLSLVWRQRATCLRGLQDSPCIVNSQCVSHIQRVPGRLESHLKYQIQK